MSPWGLLFFSLVLASGHDGRKGTTGHALNPEVAMSLSAQGEAQEETRRVMRRDGSQAAPSRKKRRHKEDPEAEEDSETATEPPEASEEDVTEDVVSASTEAPAEVEDAGSSTEAPTEVVATDSTEAPTEAEDTDAGSTEAPTEVSVDASVDETTEAPEVDAAVDPAMAMASKPTPESEADKEAKETADIVDAEMEGGMPKKGAVRQDVPTPSACDSGGSSLPRKPLTLDVMAPEKAPFTLSFRMTWNGKDPPEMEPNPVCILCWTIDPETSPSTNKAQFFRGVDGQPPRIALMRMGNVISYEELSADGKDGTSNSLTSATKLNDGSEHEVVLVRGLERITLWIDGKPDCFIASDSKDFQSPELPTGRPSGVGGLAATTNKYLRRQVGKTKTYNKMDPFKGKWALNGDVKNVRLYSKELNANQFPNSKEMCEQTTTAAPFECHSSCAACKGATEQDCISCKGLRFLHSRQCVEECPDGRFGQKTSNRCLRCHSSCATCYGDEEKNCQSCASTMVLYKSQCLSGCPANHFADTNSVCQPLAGSVIALKTYGLGQTYLLTSNSTDCVRLVPLESEEFSNPAMNIADEAKMWMVSDSGGDKAVFRNVLTGMALNLRTGEAGSEEVQGCSSSVFSCAVARPPKPVFGESQVWNDTQWGVNRCDKNLFNVLSLGNGQISLQVSGRSLQFNENMLSFTAESDADADGAGNLETLDEQRFEPLTILPAVKVKRKTTGRCAHLITNPLSCSAAVGGLGLDDFADFTQQGANPKHPPGCFYYTEEFSAPFTMEAPVKVVRVVLNVGDKDTDYLRYADCSVKMPCVCAELK